MKKVTPSAARFFVSSKCKKATSGAGEEQQEAMFDELETVNGFYYLGNRLNVSEEFEAAVTAQKKSGMEEIQRVWRNTVRKKILFADERKDI